MDPKRLLIVDDEKNIRRILQAAFERDGWRAQVADSGQEALQALEREQFDCVLTDATMPGMTGYELQAELKQNHPDLPLVVMTAYGSIPDAVQAIRNGAFEFVTKPFDLDSLKKVVTAASESHSAPTKPTRPVNSTRGFIAESPAMQRVIATIEQVADSQATVLISGESGVGKEVVSRLIHDLSPRCKGPFVAVSCAALPESLLESELFGHEKGAFTGAERAKPGRFELAHGGTLLLDEVGEIRASVQVKLLRVLQEREIERLGATSPTNIDVRLLTATNRSLDEMVEAGAFRLDLMYRLKVIEIEIPPLRERTGDILPLADHFMGKFSKLNGRQITDIASKAQDALLGYRWPGNVRELENAIERAVVLSARDSGSLTLECLPPALRAAA